MKRLDYLIRKLLILVVLFTSCYCFSQAVTKQYADSVLIAIRSQKQEAKEDSYKNLLSKISKLNIQEAKSLFEYCILKSKSDKDRLFVYEALGNYLVIKGQNNEAITHFKKGLEIAQNLNYKRGQISFGVKLSYSTLFNNQPDIALVNINKVELLIDDNTKDKLSSIYYIKGLIYDELRDIDNATTYFLKAWDEISAVENHPEKGFILFVLIEYFSRNKLALEQAVFTEKLVSYFENKETNLPDAHLPLTKALKNSISENNIEHYNKVIKISDSLNSIYSFVYTSFTLSDIYIKNNQPEKAIDVLLAVENRLDSLSSKQQVMSTYLRISEAYKNNKEFEKAHNYLESWTTLNKQIFSNTMQTSIAALEVQHDTVQKERELEKKKANQKLLVWILGLVCTILLLGAFFLYKIRGINSELKHQKQELEKTVGEKNTLLKETHHRVKNSFQIVSGLLFLKSSTIKDKAAAKVLTETQNRINSMAVLHQKLYKKDYTSGIDCQDYITDLVSDILSSYSNPHIEKKLDIEAVVLNIETVTSLGLIINELVTNSLKYAFTQNTSNPYIEIKLFTLETNLVLKVIDNGIGFSDKEIPDDTLGISLVKDLAHKINGTISFQRLREEPPNGSKITILIKDYKLQV